MGKKIRAVSMYLDDALGGMRKLNSITQIQLSDNGGAEAVFNTSQELIGFTAYEGGFSLSTDVEYVKGDPSEPDYWTLRRTRDEVNVTVDFQGGDRVQFRGVLAKFEPKGDNQASVTASVEWALGDPKLLKKGNQRL